MITINNVSRIKHLPYKDRLSKLGLSTMVFRLRGAMIEVFKILSSSIHVPYILCRGHNKKLNCLNLSLTKMYVKSISLYM